MEPLSGNFPSLGRASVRTKPQMRVELRQGETFLMSLFGQPDPAMPEADNYPQMIYRNQ